VRRVRPRFLIPQKFPSSNGGELHQDLLASGGGEANQRRLREVGNYTMVCWNAEYIGVI
jgi:hypothetical protein